MKQVMIVVLLLLCVVANVQADNSVFVGIVTHHIDSDADLNENNQLIGVKYEHFFYTTFNNSHYDRSHFLGYYFDTAEKTLYKDLKVKANLYLGISYGYADAIGFDVGGWYPAILPTVEFVYKPVFVEFVAWPADGGVIIATFGINF